MTETVGPDVSTGRQDLPHRYRVGLAPRVEGRSRAKVHLEASSAVRPFVYEDPIHGRACLQARRGQAKAPGV